MVKRSYFEQLKTLRDVDFRKTPLSDNFVPTDSQNSNRANYVPLNKRLSGANDANLSSQMERGD